MSSNSITLLRPGSGVDLVFELDSPDPATKPSIIFEHNDKQKQVIVAQPTRIIPSDFSYRQMHLSCLVQTESEKVRFGYPCKIINTIRNYTLSAQNTAPALLLEYQEPPIAINIRSAFRLHPGPRFEVMGKIVYKGQSFYSGVHFKVYNISTTGLGILIPKKIKNMRNPLLDLETGTRPEIGLLLRTLPAPGGNESTGKESSKEEAPPIETIKTVMRIVRVNTNYNEMSGYGGAEFSKLTWEHEEKLNKFIHNAQLHEIRLRQANGI